MQISMELPEDIVKALGNEPASISRTALEMLAADGYRSGRLSEAQVRRLLGFGTRYEVHGFLKEHGVDLSYGEDALERDLAFVDRGETWSSSQTPRR